MSLLLPILSRDAPASPAPLTLPILSYTNIQEKAALTLPIFAVEEKPQMPTLALPIAARAEEMAFRPSLSTLASEGDLDSILAMASKKRITWADDEELVDVVYISSRDEVESVEDEEDARFNAMFESMLQC
jgi:hypothetical protein